MVYKNKIKLPSSFWPLFVVVVCFVVVCYLFKKKKKKKERKKPWVCTCVPEYCCSDRFDKPISISDITFLSIFIGYSQLLHTKELPLKVLKYSYVHLSLLKNDPFHSSVNGVVTTDRKILCLKKNSYFFLSFFSLLLFFFSLSLSLSVFFSFFFLLFLTVSSRKFPATEDEKPRPCVACDRCTVQRHLRQTCAAETADRTTRPAGCGGAAVGHRGTAAGSSSGTAGETW